MGKRAYGPLDRLLESWARWLSDSRTGSITGGDSMLARLIESKGFLIFGGSGSGASPACDTVEGRVEILVYEMGKVAPMRADVLRMEYAAGCRRVAVARGWKNYSPGQNQLSNALLLGVSLRTYKTRLSEARAQIAAEFGVSN